MTIHILYGKKKDEWEDVAKSYLKKFSGGIPIRGRLIKVNYKSRGEFVRSEYSKKLFNSDVQLYKDKMSLAGNVDEIVLASTNYINQDLNHERKDSIKQFAVGNVLLKIGKRNYKADVLVGFTSGADMLLYDIININPTDSTIKNDGYTKSLIGQANKSPTYSSGTPTIDQHSYNDVVNSNIPQDDSVVKNNSLPSIISPPKTKTPPLLILKIRVKIFV